LAPLSEPSPALQPKEFPGPFPREKAGGTSKAAAGRISE
jgi:hypothetical protein